MWFGWLVLIGCVVWLVGFDWLCGLVGLIGCVVWFGWLVLIGCVVVWLGLTGCVV